MSQTAAYQATFSPRVVDVLNEWGYIYVLLKDGRVSIIMCVSVCVMHNVTARTMQYVFYVCPGIDSIVIVWFT